MTFSSNNLRIITNLQHLERQQFSATMKSGQKTITITFIFLTVFGSLDVSESNNHHHLQPQPPSVTMRSGQGGTFSFKTSNNF